SSAFDAVDDLLSDAPPRVTPPPGSIPTSPALPAKPRFLGAPPIAPPKAPAQVGAADRPDNIGPVPPAPQPAAVKGPILDSSEVLAKDDSSTPTPTGAATHRWRYWLLTAGSAVAGVVIAF